MTDTAVNTKRQIDEPAIGNLVCQHLRQSVPAAGAMALSVDTRLLEGGLLDSLGVLQLTLFLGEHFGVEIEDTDFVPENFETIGDVARLIQRKLPGAA